MEFLSTLLDILKKPFPEEDNRAIYFRNTVLIGCFVTLFLYIFQPFGISTIEEKKFLICVGFGLMTIVAAFIYNGLTFGILKIRGGGKILTFGEWILHMIGFMLTISLVNFLFARSLFGTMRWEFLPTMILSTFAIGIFPTVILGLLSLRLLEKRHQELSERFNLRHRDSARSLQDDDRKIFDIPVNRIRYIEALQNYVRIGYINDQGVLTEDTQRITIKSILEDLTDTPVIRCHRSFLVNRDAVISCTGNAQGLLLSLADCVRTIPVSRSYVSIFKDG